MNVPAQVAGTRRSWVRPLRDLGIPLGLHTLDRAGRREAGRGEAEAISTTVLVGQAGARAHLPSDAVREDLAGAAPGLLRLANPHHVTVSFPVATPTAPGSPNSAARELRRRAHGAIPPWC